MDRHRATLLLLLSLAACTSNRTPDTGPSDATLDGLDASPRDVALEADLTELPDVPHCPGPFAPPSAAELTVRHTLGVPDDASCVMLLGQNSHLDIDWQHTFDDYYAMWVESIFSNATQLLQTNPTYRYSICEMGYLAHHLAVHPEQQPILRDAVSRGALHIVGGGITSPDTLLPTSEALIRDYLRGTIFAETQLGATVHAAWLPDSFGHAPTVPDLLSGMGIDAVAFARVDGLHDAIEHLRGQPFIVPNSTASTLTAMATTDFVWTGPGGGSVLAHWMPFRLYCEGDGIDTDGLILPGQSSGGTDRSGDTAYTHTQIERYLGELAPMARTPYFFVPVGCDFQPPKPHLTDIAAEWNASQYASTGLYVVAASFEDYAALLAPRTADLPRLSPDMADYFTGYFGERLAVKAGARSAGDSLLRAEATALVAETVAHAPWPADALAQAWDLVSRTNHHDFISGTSLDEVVTGEQLPLLASLDASIGTLQTNALTALAGAIAMVSGAPATLAVVGTVGRMGPRVATVPLTFAPGVAHDLSADVPSQILASTRNADGSLATATLLVVPQIAPLGYTRLALHDAPAQGPVSLTDDGVQIVLTDAASGLRAVVDRAAGMLQSLQLGASESLVAPSLGIRGWSDQGGLYRIGSETQGCHFTDAGSVGGAVTVQVLERGPARARIQIQRGATTLVVGLVAGTGRLDVDVTAPAANAQTNTVQVFTTASGATGTFVHAGGSVTRAPTGLYVPQFWPVVRGMDLARADGTGIAVLPSTSTGLRFGSDGSLDLVVSRNAPSEQCDVLGASGSEQGPPTVSFALEPHAQPIDVLADALALLPAPAVQVTAASGATADTATLFTLGGSGYVLSAAKHAERGTGLVLRFERTSGGDVQLGAGLLAPTSLTRTDLLERDQASTTATIALDASWVTVRVGM